MRRNATNTSRVNFRYLKELIRVSALAALGDKKGLRKLFASRAFQRIPKIKVEETLLEIHLFAGFPATIDAFIELRKFSIDRPGQSVLVGVTGDETDLYVAG